MTELPIDVEDLVAELAGRDELKEAHNGARAFRLVKDSAEKYGIKIERLKLPISICNGHAHVVKPVEMAISELDNYMSTKASPLKIYRAKISGTDIRLRVCQCTSEASGIEILARQAIERE